MAIDYTKVNQNEQIMEVLRDVNLLKAEVESTHQPGQVDIRAIFIELRNKVLGGGGVKAAFMGTIAAQPTVSAADLQTLGYTAAAANQIINERNLLRQYFLDLKDDAGNSL